MINLPAEFPLIAAPDVTSARYDGEATVRGYALLTDDPSLSFLTDTFTGIAFRMLTAR